MRRVDPAVATAFGCIVVLLLVGSLYSTSFLSPQYLLQQLQIGAFLGIIATGSMLVILLGQIDLSIPWAVAVGGMTSTAAAGYGPVGVALAIPFGILCGVVVGAANGFGVAYLRVPSMIFTLGVNAVAQGLMILRTGRLGAAGPGDRDDADPGDRTSRGRRAECRLGMACRGDRSGVRPGADDLRPCGLRHREPRAGGLFVWRAHAPGRVRGVHDRGRLIGLRRDAAGGLFGQGLSGHGRPYLLPRSPPSCSAALRSSAGAAPSWARQAGVILITLLQSILSVMQIFGCGPTGDLRDGHSGDAAVVCRAARISV